MAEYPEKDFLEFLVKSIVDHPEDVEAERKIDEMGVLLSLKVNRQDMGQVVGRDGSTAKAIRSLLRIVGVKNNARVNLKILEPEGGRRPERTERPAPAPAAETPVEGEAPVPTLSQDSPEEQSRGSSTSDTEQGSEEAGTEEPKIEEPSGAINKVIEDIKDL